MPAPQISPLPTPPSRSQSPETFSVDADAFLGALPDFQSEANDQADYLDALAIDVTADAAAAEASAVIASGAANYQGDYSAGTTYQIGESVSYLGRRYVAKTVNTGVTPVDGANWFIIAELPAPSTAGNILTSDGTNWASLAPLGANLPVITRTNNIEIVANDKGKLIEYTAGGFTQTFASAAALGAGWWCYVYNKAIPQFETSGGWFNRGLAPSGATQLDSITNAFLTDDGLYIYYLHSSATNRGRIFRLQLGTAGNFSTIQSTVQVFNADSQILAGGEAIHFRPDGLRMFVFAKPSGASQTTVFVYNLTTPWQISSGVTYSGTSFTFDLTSTIDARMSNNGTRVYISNNGNIRQYNLGTAWDFTSVTTASTTTINPPVTFNQSFLFNRDGTKLFATRVLDNYRIYFFQYNLSTPWEVNTRSFYGSMGAEVSSGMVIRGNMFNTSSAGIFAVGTASSTNSFIDFALDPQGNLMTQMADQSSGDIVLDPNGSETIDGRTSFVSYPGELRLITCDGSNLNSAPLKGFNRVFTSSTYFTPPTGYSAFSVECLGAGGGGTDGNATVTASGSGGGGGAYSTRIVRAELLRSSSLLISVGAGGTRGTPLASNGGASFFGPYVYANGGSTGGTGYGGAGAGIYISNQLQPTPPTSAWATFGGGRGATTSFEAVPSIYGGGGGGNGINNVSPRKAATSVYGGGGGSSGTGNGSDNTPNSGGRRTITFGGNLSDASLTGSFLTEDFGGGGFGAEASVGASATLVKIGDGGGGSGAAGFVGGNGGLGGGGGGGNYNFNTALGTNGGNGGNGLVVVQGII